jgi:alpha-glucoside transport system substrate-binding protein
VIYPIYFHRRKTMIYRHKILLTLILLMLTATLAVGCGSPATPLPTTVPTTVAPTAAPTAAATVASQNLNGAHVRVLGLWSGPELDSFMTVKSAWEKDTGGVVEWDGTQDLPAVLTARMQAGNPPDIAILPNPGLMQQLARERKLVPLNSFMDMNQVNRDYASAWIDLGSSNGDLYAIFYKVSNKATVWYNPRAFAVASYTVPSTWDDMTTLADKMVANGHTPFSIAAPSGPASGWALTDWISEIVLNNCGPDLYDKWITGEVPWIDACIRQSFELFDEIVQTKGYVLGGSQGILATTDANGTYPLYTDPPAAYMDYLASFAQAFIASKYPDLNPGDDYNFFAFPTINPEYAGTVTIGADVVVMANDTPAARSFMTYLAGARAQAAWIKLGGFTSVNRSISPDIYMDPVARAVAKELTEARVSRFGAGDMMPTSLQKAWWTAMLDLVQDPSKLDSILNSLTNVAQQLRRTAFGARFAKQIEVNAK